MNIKRLIIILNKVTSCHRHGVDIPRKYLDDLCNAQIEIEKSYESEKIKFITGCYKIRLYKNGDLPFIPDSDYKYSEEKYIETCAIEEYKHNWVFRRIADELFKNIYG